MSDAVLDLLFWIIVLIALFFGLRFLQKKNKDKNNKD